ncbi:MAG: hypothetical protein JKY19_12280 [Alcanivoracaceae bacterium]|nr:hypothetical protein [Alcanivoracaceae bacterium]
MYKIQEWQLNNFVLAVLLIIVSVSTFAENNGSQPDVGMAVRNDTSPPLIELLDQYQQLKESGVIPDQAADYIIPNILQIDPSPAEIKFNQRTPQEKGVSGSSGLPTAPVLISVDGFTAADDTAILGGVPLPPDTNGDVGINFYIQYVNLGWLVLNKNDGSRAAGPFLGNIFWAGFGGACESDNSGDPIVLYDKLADRWVFSQFTSSSNTDGHQCFAISTTNDPLGPYHRYEFTFPGEFNDYPHIGIWNDESGQRSGYYFVTHDFFDVGGPNQAFRQASYSVVERSQMLQGNPAQFVRFTNTTFLGSSSFGAQPAHLESKELPAAGTCNPFVFGRPDLSGYQLVSMCVNWTNTATSFLTAPLIVDAGESWNPGPGSVAQAGTAETLDTLANFGRIMYRASYRAYPDSSTLTDTMVISLPVDLGGGQAGVRWAQINFPPNLDLIFIDGFEGNTTPLPPNVHVVANQGEYGPDSTDRWMPGISIDRDGNIGLVYSVSNSSTGIFPGVRFTTRLNSDTPNTLRDEQICVDGGGAQTSTSGRWGDYSSLSIDPVDECTFWASVEYQLTTAERNWSNRVCSFKVDGCGGPSFSLDSTVTTSMNVCSANMDSTFYDYGLNVINGFTETVNLSVSNEPAGANVNFPGGVSVSTFPATGTFEISNLMGMPSDETDMTLTAMSASITNTLNYHLSISAATTNTAATLTQPANNSVDTDLLPTFTWQAVADALSYRLEVATDAAFVNVVLNVETSSLSYISTQALDINTTFFWRVTGLNNCGDGLVSATSQFTTGSFVTGTAAECPLGTSANIVFFDDIEGDVSDWIIPAAPVGSNTWTQNGTRSFSGSAWFAQDLPVSSDQYLVSPPIVLPQIAQSPISLAYWNFQDMEANNGVNPNACWDGGLLEISTNGGATFTQIGSADLLGDQYNGNITVNASNPISGLDAWCATGANSATGEQTDFSVVNLDAFAGQTVQFRFRVGTDGAVGAEGWYLDNVTVQGCQ